MLLRNELLDQLNTAGDHGGGLFIAEICFDQDPLDRDQGREPRIPGYSCVDRERASNFHGRPGPGVRPVPPMQHGDRNARLFELLEYFRGGMIAVDADDARVVRNDLEYLPEHRQLALKRDFRSLVEPDLADDGTALHQFPECGDLEILLRQDISRVAPDAPQHDRVNSCQLPGTPPPATRSWPGQPLRHRGPRRRANERCGRGRRVSAAAGQRSCRIPFRENTATFSASSFAVSLPNRPFCSREAFSADR